MCAERHDTCPVSRALVFLLFALLVPAQSAAAGVTDDEREARVAGVCAGGAVSALRLKADDGRLEVRFRVARGRVGSWRVVLVHESRVDWRGASRTTAANRSFEVRRTLRDLPGSDTVTARAWGPGGVTCRATATVT